MIEHSKGLELPKIVRGVEARPHEFPFMVSDNPDGQDGEVMVRMVMMVLMVGMVRMVM